MHARIKALGVLQQGFWKARWGLLLTWIQPLVYALCPSMKNSLVFLLLAFKINPAYFLQSMTCGVSEWAQCSGDIQRPGQIAIMVKSKVWKRSWSLLAVSGKDSKEIRLEWKAEHAKAQLPEGKSRSRHPLNNWINLCSAFSTDCDLVWWLAVCFLPGLHTIFSLLKQL